MCDCLTWRASINQQAVSHNAGYPTGIMHCDTHSLLDVFYCLVILWLILCHHVLLPMVSYIPVSRKSFGTILFSSCILPLGHIHKHSLYFHCYAEDTLINLPIRATDLGTSSVPEWKTETIVIGSYLNFEQHTTKQYSPVFTIK